MPTDQLSLFTTDAPVQEQAEVCGGGVARVQLEGSAALELDYGIPEKLAARLGVGTRVMVPLQNQRVPAVVIELLATSEHRGRLKEIASIVGSRPMFTPGLLKLAEWVSDYYIVPVHRVLRAMLPQAQHVQIDG